MKKVRVKDNMTETKPHYHFIDERTKRQIAEFLDFYWDNPDQDPDFICSWLEDKGIIRMLKEIKGEPRFRHTYCSQCGADFGPGDHGYSHCKNHRMIDD